MTGQGGRIRTGWGSSVARGRRVEEPPTTGAAAEDPDPDPETVARTILLRMLTGAPRSRAQLSAKLAQRDVPDEVAERVLDRFAEVGLIDDAAYAEVVVHSARASRGLGRRAVAQELRRRGVGPEDAEQALGEVDDAADEETARALVARRWQGWAGLSPEVRARRAFGMLARKGFSGAVASRVIREMGDDRGTPSWNEPESDLD